MLRPRGLLFMLEALYPIEHSRSLSNPYIELGVPVMISFQECLGSSDTSSTLLTVLENPCHSEL